MYNNIIILDKFELIIYYKKVLNVLKAPRVLKGTQNDFNSRKKIIPVKV